MIDKPAKPRCSIEVLRDEVTGRDAVFTRTKHGADKVVRSLHHAGISAEAIHGNKSQNQRERVLGALPRRQAAARWSRPTSRRAASTSTASAT